MVAVAGSAFGGKISSDLQNRQKERLLTHVLSGFDDERFTEGRWSGKSPRVGQRLRCSWSDLFRSAALRQHAYTKRRKGFYRSGDGAGLKLG